MSTQTSDNNKRIAKNTLFFYFRMTIMMVELLYIRAELNYNSIDIK